MLLAGAPSARAADVYRIPLVDQRGERFTLGDLRGHSAALAFVATRCTDVCPIVDVVFARVAARLLRAHSGAQLVTITLDPVYDSPFVMASPARSYAANTAHWRWVSGLPANVKRIPAAFNVAHDGPQTHSTFVYVLDRHGKLRRTLLLGLDADGPIFNFLH